MNIDVYELFPTIVMSTSLDRQLTNTETDIIENEMKNIGKNAGNWTGLKEQLFKEDGMQGLADDILKVANVYFDKVFTSKNNPELYYVQSWVNVTHTGEHHHVHCHCNSFLSGCFYYDVEEGDQIRFHNTVEQNKMFYFIPREDTRYNARSWWVPIKKNDIVIWRSELHHDVPTLNTERERPRVSIAFNIFLRGEVGGNELRTGLNIG